MVLELKSTSADYPPNIQSISLSYPGKNVPKKFQIYEISRLSVEIYQTLTQLFLE